jgi:hypothetical protein
LCPDLNENDKYLRAAIRFITVVWRVRINQVLSDKDITEINALLAELPDDIKYQLCFWHCIRAVNTSLSVLGCHPAHHLPPFEQQLKPLHRTAQDSSLEWVKKRIIEAEASLAVLKTQVSHPREAKIFLNSMKAQNIGGDLAVMANDVRQFTETGTVRTNTCAER